MHKIFFESICVWSFWRRTMQTSVSTNRKNENPCMNHLGEPLIASAPRKGLFEFIKQDDVESTER
jgi:hypothetical protein